MRGLYPIIDVDSLRARGLPIVKFAARVLEAEPNILQLRAKNLGARETLALLRELKPLCARAKCSLFANDRADLAVMAECDGVHVGQDDLGVEDVRAVAPQLRVGVSTHNLEQLEKALALRPDYVAFGPIFRTLSKQRPDPVVGLELLAVATERARAHDIPLVAIGGIDLEHAREIAKVGAMAAVIGALLPANGELDLVSRQARALSEILRAS